MRGHLKNRNGNYTIVIYHGKDPITGKKKYTWHSCNQMLGRKAGKKEAEALLAEMLKNVVDDKFVIPEKITLREYLIDHWLPHIKSTVRENTFIRYAGIVNNHLIPNLGGLQVSKIKPAAIQKLYRTLMEPGSRKDKKTGGLSPRSVQYVHVTLYRALKQAVAWQMIATNPADSVEIPKQAKKEMKVWSIEQVKTFLSAIPSARWKALYSLAFSTGMRLSEILGLRWKDIDFDNGTLSVRQGLHYHNGEFTFDEPKTKNSKRTITLPADTVKALKAYKHEQNQKYMKAKKERKAVYEKYPDLVFRSRVGTPTSPHNVIRHFRDTQAALDLPPLNFHEIRHTHATMLLQSGEHIKVVSERLGHASVSTTMDLYSHVLPCMQQSTAVKLQGMLFSD